MPRYLSWLSAMAVCHSLMACGGGDGSEDVSAPCLAPNRLVGERCLGPGVADDGCEAGSLGQSDGGCAPAGMIASDCAEGFVHVPFDGASAAGSCEPVLPIDPCPAGLMALPGETVCRPVMDCGSGTFGNIVTDATTEHVNAAYMGGSSDGSETAPWTMVGEAVAAAAPGSIIAIAAGSYVEEVSVQGKPVQIRGVCPRQVELVGSSSTTATLTMRTGASGTSVQGIAIHGPGAGVLVSGSEDVLLENVWVHDNPVRGIAVQDNLGVTSAVVRDSLLEDNGDFGIFAGGSGIQVASTVVRNTQPVTQNSFGRGIDLEFNPDSGAAAVGSIEGSLIERNHDFGVFVGGSEAAVEATVVRDTLRNGQELVASGISFVVGTELVAPSIGSVHASTLERNDCAGIIISGSDVDVEATTIRDTTPDGQGGSGRGISIEFDVDVSRTATSTVRRSLVERAQGVGLLVYGAESTVELTVVRDMLPDAHGLFGRGIIVQAENIGWTPGQARIVGSRVERTQEIGITVVDANADIHGSLVVGTAPNTFGLFGDGLTVAHAQPVGALPSANIVATRIQDSSRAGVSDFGAHVTLTDVAIACSAFDLAGESLNGVSATFDDAGGNACGCASPVDCKAIGAGLQPPTALP